MAGRLELECPSFERLEEDDLITYRFSGPLEIISSITIKRLKLLIWRCKGVLYQ